MQQIPCSQDATFLKQTVESFRAVLSGKVSGLQLLENQIGNLPLVSLMLYASVSALVAPTGQPNYAAANAMLGAWASNGAEKVQIPLPPRWPSQMLCKWLCDTTVLHLACHLLRL